MSDGAWSSGVMMLVRDNNSTCPVPATLSTADLHMALPVIEVVQIAELQFGYLFIVYQYSYTAPWPKHVADYQSILCHCASVGSLSKCKY